MSRHDKLTTGVNLPLYHYYLGDFLGEKTETALMGLSGAWGNMIHRKPEVKKAVTICLYVSCFRMSGLEQADKIIQYKKLHSPS
jgi:hypothetical protein